MAFQTRQGSERISLEASIERYNRQLRTEGWDVEKQRKLYNSKVLLLGCDILGEMTLGCLIGLGVGNIFVMDNKDKKINDKSFLLEDRKKGSRVHSLVDSVKKLDSTINIRGMHTKFSVSFLSYYDFEPDIIVDTLNRPDLKEEILGYLLTNKEKRIDFISSYCNHKKSILSVYNRDKRNIEEILNSEKIIEEDSGQGSVISGINAGMIADEVRKAVFRLNEKDYRLNKRVFYNLDSSERNSLESNINKTIGDLKDVKTLVVGGGAIGNYVSLNLALSGFRNIDIIDFDRIEESNLNRQILFFNREGENKAEVLKEKLREIGKAKMRVFVYKITEDSGRFFEKNKYDLIFGCLDNFEARYYLNQFAVENKIPYIDGGTSDLSGNLAVYYPGKTSCIGCKKELTPEPIKRSCADALPSVVIPNMIIGSAMVGEAANILRGEIMDKRFIYDSFNKDRLYLEEESKTKKECKCLN